MSINRITFTDISTAPIKLSSQRLNMWDIKLRLSQNFLDQLIGEHSPFNTIGIENKGVIIGYIIADHVVPESFDNGDCLKLNTVKTNAETLFSGDILSKRKKIRIGITNENFEYSFISSGLYDEINELTGELNAGQSTLFDTDQDAITPRGNRPHPSTLTGTATDPIQNYRFIERSGKKRVKWIFEIGNKRAFFGDATKRIAQLLLETDEPLSIKEISEKLGMRIYPHYFEPLKTLGILQRYTQQGTKEIFYTTATEDNPRTVDKKFTPYNRQSVSKAQRTAAQNLPAPQEELSEKVTQAQYKPSKSPDMIMSTDCHKGETQPKADDNLYMPHPKTPDMLILKR